MRFVRDQDLLPIAGAVYGVRYNSQPDVQVFIRQVGVPGKLTNGIVSVSEEAQFTFAKSPVSIQVVSTKCDADDLTTAVVRLSGGRYRRERTVQNVQRGDRLLLSGGWHVVEFIHHRDAVDDCPSWLGLRLVPAVPEQAMTDVGVAYARLSDEQRSSKRFRRGLRTLDKVKGRRGFVRIIDPK